MNPKRISRDQRIDILRILAASWVVLFHWWAAVWGYPSVFPQSLSQFLKNISQFPFGPFYTLSVLGDNAVPLFIAIAAYCLAKKQRVGWGWIPDRLRKILFPYWVAILISFPLLALAWKLNPSLMKLAEVRPLTLEGIIAAALLLQNSFKATFLAPIQAWWFVPILVHLYLIYPLLSRLRSNRSAFRFLTITILLQLAWNGLIISRVLATNEIPLLLRFSGPSYLALFAVGMILAEAKRRPSWLTGAIFWFGGILLRFATNRLFLFSETLIGTGLLLIGLPLAEALIRRTPILAEKLSILGKKRSYLVYLLHQPIIYVLLIFSLPFFSKPLITLLPFLAAGLWVAINVKR